MSATVRKRELAVREATQRVHRAEETIHRWSWASVPTPRERSFSEWVATSRHGALAAMLLPTVVLVRSSLRIERSGLDSAIVDASVGVEFVAPDADDTEPIHVLLNEWAQTGEDLHAPAMLPLEVMNTAHRCTPGLCRQPMPRPVSLPHCRFHCTTTGATDIRHGS
jgi:hypothetical protein